MDWLTLNLDEEIDFQFYEAVAIKSTQSSSDGIFLARFDVSFFNCFNDTMLII